MDNIPIEFQRTVCACSQCKACCKRQPAALIPRDLERITDYIAETQKCDREIAFQRLKAQVWASPGALVRLDGQTMRIGTITPRWDRKRKRCVFLTDDDKCSIHPVAPFGCAYYDTHMGPVEAHERSLWQVQQQVSPAYQMLRNKLPLATHYKPLPFG